MLNIYNFLMDANFIVLNGEPEGYKRKAAQYILKRIEHNKVKTEFSSLLNLSFKTILITEKIDGSWSLSRNNFQEIYNIYNDEFFDFIIFESIPNLSPNQWEQFKFFAIKNKLQCIFLGANNSNLQDISLYVHFNSFDDSVDVVLYPTLKRSEYLLNSFYI